MTMTMIQKVATVIRQCDAFHAASVVITNNELREIAKVAIEAMREPSDELLNILGNDGWDAMIDAALKE